MHQPTETEFNQIIDSHPLLCSLGWWNESNTRDLPISLEYDRSDLRNQFDEFLACVEWIKGNCIPTKTIAYRSPHSRTLQQRAKEQLKTYVGNGAMIAAIIYSGIPIKPHSDSPNPSCGVSKKSLCFKGRPF